MRVVKKYAVVTHEEPEGRFWAEVPALPGCYLQGRGRVKAIAGPEVCPLLEASTSAL